MEFLNIVISNPAEIFIRGGQLIIRQAEDVSVPVEDLCTLMIECLQVTISAAALDILAVQGVTVFICDNSHLPSAQLLPFHQYSRQRKLLQAQFELPKPTKKRIWQAIVQEKIRNQARCLKILDRRGSAELEKLASSVRSGDTDNREAVAAAFYFKCLFGENFTRSSDCLVNTALNYGYSILRGSIARNLVLHGLDPAIGIFHHSELNSFNLADDVLEPFRPLVDLFVASQNYGEETELRPPEKHKILNLTNYMLLQNNQRIRTMTSVDRTTASLSTCISEQRQDISLPQLIALEEYGCE